MMKSKKPKEEPKEKHVDELRMQLARALADYDNLKKRVDSEKTIWFKVAAGRVVEKFLGIMDMLLDAQKHLNDAGLAIVIGEFKKAIVEEGFEEIKIEEGVTDFDEQMMEAVEVVEKDGSKENSVAEVVQSGWKSKDEEGRESFIVRPAKVKVYK